MAITAESRACSSSPMRWGGGRTEGRSPTTPSSSASSAASTAAPSAGRPAGSFTSRWATSSSRARGKPGTTSESRGASSIRILASSAMTCAATNTGRPARHSNSTQPRENTSAAGPSSRTPAGLLRGHVTRRPDSDPGARGGARRVRAGEARDAEIEELGARDVARGQHDVLRLDVAVHDGHGVGLREGAGDHATEGDRARQREPPAGEALGEALALHPLHREPRLALLRAARVDETHDGRVRERGEHLGLPREALVGVPIGQDLHRHDLAARPVPRPVDTPHPAHAGEALKLEALGEEES
jgi:hypothetical protein